MSCSRTVSDKIITFNDKGNSKCQMIFNNPEQKTVVKHRVDACLIEEGERCDFKLDCPNFENYIEIKGKDIFYACLQIEESIKKLSTNVKSKPKKSFVIATGAPTTGGKMQIVTKKFKLNYNSSLIIRTRKHIENL